MKIVGLITEYNPFHNGHKYHIEQALRMSHADAVIVVMSGDFVQRGTPAIMPKRLRAASALLSGAAAVFELPVVSACSSAEYFAKGAIELLHSLGCVDSICFGAECSDSNMLEAVADILKEEPAGYQEELQRFLRMGNSYPVARKLAIEKYTGVAEFASVLDKPNNILGIEYIKAIKRLNSSMDIHVLQRISSDYHDSGLQENFSSATSIRNVIEGTDTFPDQKLFGQIPDNSLDFLSKCYHKNYPVNVEDFALLLQFRLLSETKDSLQSYTDVSPELANRIINRRNNFTGWNSFCEDLKTREVTYSRISRCLMHILLDIKKCDDPDTTLTCRSPYAHLLGFSSEKKEVLAEIKKCSQIPLVSKAGDVCKLDSYALKLLEKDIYASNVYETVLAKKFQQPFIHEWMQKIMII